MAITLKEIAERANVSRGTVDRVLHNRYGVSPSVRERVLKIVMEANYQPNVMAKALQKAGKPMRFGAIIPNTHNQFYCKIDEGIKEAAQRLSSYGVEVIKYEMKGSSAAEQAEYIDKLLEQQITGLALVPFDTASIVEKLRALPEDIPVVTMNSDIRGTKRACFVGNDHVAAGMVAGRLLSSVLPPHKRVATIISQMDFLAHLERLKGFQQFLKEENRCMTIDGPYFTHENEQNAYEIVEELLASSQRPDAIYMAGGGQQAACRALREHGADRKTLMICHDLLPETVRCIKEGFVPFSIGQEPFMQGYMPIEILYEIKMFGHTPRLEKLYTPIDVRMKENVDFIGYEVFRSCYAK